VEQLLRSGLALTDLCETLLETLGEDAFPGEDTGQVLLEMLTGTLLPVTEAAGPRTLADATALVAAAHDRVIADLERARDRAAAR